MSRGAVQHSLTLRQGELWERAKCERGWSNRRTAALALLGYPCVAHDRNCATHEPGVSAAGETVS